MQYEINYLALQSKTAALDKIRQKIKNLIESKGGKILAEKNYLKRKLAYEIKHENYGFYTVLRFDLEDTEKLSELKKDLNLNQDITRYILVRTDSLPPLETSLEEEQKEDSAKESKKEEKIIQASEVEKIINNTAKTTPENISDQKEIQTRNQGEIVKKEQPKETTTTIEPKEKSEPKTKKEKIKETTQKEDDTDSLDELDKKLDEILNM